MARPTARASSMIGAPSLSATTMVWWASSMASALFTGELPPSDRHLGDVLIGLDDAVAHGDHRLERDLGVVDGGGDLREIGLAGDGLQARRLALVERRADIAGRL